MRKIILDLAVSLDGFIEGPKGETDWCILDEDMDFDGFLAGIDTIFYGRVSYDTWGNFQPENNASPAEKQFWGKVHAKRKVVFTRQPRDDQRALFLHGNLEQQVHALKQQTGEDIWLYGGAGLIKTFIRLGLIDTYRLSVHPLALGSGKPLFEDLNQRLALKLIDTRVFRSGVVQLVYEP